MNRIFMYGIAGARDSYRVVRYSYLEEGAKTIRALHEAAMLMRLYNPSVEHVYAIDERPNLYREYQDTIKKNTVEANVVFKCTLEVEGLKII